MQRDKILNNFTGMSFEKQFELINFICNDEEIDEESKIDLKETFKNYFERLSEFLENREEYNTLNSNRRRYIRAYVLDYFSSNLRSLDEKNINKKNNNKVLTISDEEVNLYMDEFKNMHERIKSDDVDILIYNNRNIMTYLYPTKNIDKFISMYSDVVKKVIGEELVKYYNMMSDKVKYDIVRLIIDLTYITKDHVEIINDKEAVRKLKLNVAEKCEKELYYKNKVPFLK